MREIIIKKRIFKRLKSAVHGRTAVLHQLLFQGGKDDHGVKRVVIHMLNHTYFFFFPLFIRGFMSMWSIS